MAAGARQFRTGRHAAAIGGHGRPTRSPLSERGLAAEFSLNNGDATLWGFSRISNYIAFCRVGVSGRCRGPPYAASCTSRDGTTTFQIVYLKNFVDTFRFQAMKRAGRPKRSTSRFGLKTMSLERLTELIDAARSEARRRLSEIEASLG